MADCFFSAQGDFKCRKNSIEKFSDTKNKTKTVEKFSSKENKARKLVGKTTIRLTDDNITKDFVFDARNPACWAASGIPRYPKYFESASTTCNGSWSASSLSSKNKEKIEALLKEDNNSLACGDIDDAVSGLAKSGSGSCFTEGANHNKYKPVKKGMRCLSNGELVSNDLCDNLEDLKNKCNCVQSSGGKSWCYIGDCPSKFKGGVDDRAGWGRSGSQNATPEQGFTYTGRKKWAYLNSKLFKTLGLIGKENVKVQTPVVEKEIISSTPTVDSPDEKEDSPDSPNIQEEETKKSQIIYI